jgi:tape measure domain-containing protein
VPLYSDAVKGYITADVNIGDVVARLRLETSEWQRGLQQATQQLTQFQQQLSSVTSGQGAQASSTNQLAAAYVAMAEAIAQQAQAYAQAQSAALQYRREQDAAREALRQQRAEQQQTSQAARDAAEALRATYRQQREDQAQAARASEETQRREEAATLAALRGRRELLQAAQAAAQQAAQQAPRAAAAPVSQLPLGAIQNATEQFSRAMQQAGNSQDRMRQGIAQAQQALAQFNVTIDASGRMTDRFGQGLSREATEGIRQFRTGIREAQAELTQFQRFGINQAAGGAGGGILQQMLGIAGGLGIATTIQGITRSLTNFVSESVQLAAKMQDLHRSFTAIDGSGGAANVTIARLFATAQRVGVEFTALAESFKRLDVAARGTSLEGEGIRRVFEGVVSGARVLGVGSAEVSRGLVALEQAMTKGKLSAEEYRRQLGNAIPGALAMMAQGLGVTTKALDEMVALGIIPVESAIIALGNTMGGLREKLGQAGIEKLTDTFAKLKNETTAWMTALGESVGQTLQPFLQTLTTISEKLRDIFAIRAPGQQAVPGASTSGGMLGWLFGPTTMGMPAPGTLGPTEQPGPAQPQAGFDWLGAFRTRRPGGPAGQALVPIARQAAEAQGIDPAVFHAMLMAESGYRNIEGPTRQTAPGRFERAQGPGQVLPSTGAEYGFSLEDLRDPSKNLEAAAKIFRDYRDRIRRQFGVLEDETKIVLAAYNGGITRVVAALEETKKIGEPLTYGQVIGRFPAQAQPETRQYVARITGTTPAVPGAPGAQAPQDPFAPMLKTAADVGAALKTITERIDAIARSDLNKGGLLNDALNQQADEAIAKYKVLALQLAAFPELAAKLTAEQRAQVDAVGQQVLVLQERVAQEAQTEAGARRRVNELRQIEEEERRITEQARLRVPQLDAQLARLQAFTERPGTSAAAQAAAAVQQQGAELAAQARKTLEELTQHPAILRFAPHIREQIEAGLAALPEAVARQSALAFQKVDEQLRDHLRGIDDQITQIGLRAGAAGFSRLDAEVAQVRLAFEKMGQDLEARDRELAARRREAEPGQRPGIDTQRARIAEMQAQLPSLREAAITQRTEAFGRQQRDAIAGIEDQAEQLAMKLNAAGLDPLAADLARIDRSFVGLLDKAKDLDQTLSDLSTGATAQEQAAIAAVRERLGLITAITVEEGRQLALQERRERAGRALIEQNEATLEQLRQGPQQGFPITDTPEVTRIRQAATLKDVTAEQRDYINSQADAVQGQQRLNYAFGIFEQLGYAVANAWTPVWEALFAPKEDPVDRVGLANVRERLAEARDRQRALRESQATNLPERLTQAQQAQAENAATSAQATVRALEDQEKALLKVEEGTHRVADAFREMGRSILQTMAQIAQQETMKLFMRLAFSLLSGAVGGAIAPAAAPSADPGGGTAIGQMLAPQFDFGLGGVGAGTGGGAAMGGGIGFSPMFETFQHGGVVTAPTMAMMGEGPQHTLPEYVLNRQQMDAVMNRSGSNQGSQIVVNNFPSQRAAEEDAMRQRSQGKQVIVNEVLGDLAQGSGSKIGRAMRLLQQ